MPILPPPSLNPTHLNTYTEQPSLTTTQQPVTTLHTTHPITDATTPTAGINLTSIVVVVVVVIVFMLVVLVIMAAVVIVVIFLTNRKRRIDSDFDEDEEGSGEEEEGNLQEDASGEWGPDAICRSKTNPNTTKPDELKVKVDGEEEEGNLQENSSDEGEPWSKIWFESCL